MRAINLKTNHLTAPVGIDAGPLFLSWQCADGVRQTAYEIELTANGETVWHSGKVQSTAMHADAPTVGGSRVRGCWRVRLWDENGAPGAWSEARFETGLAQCDWAGEWVDPETEPIDIPGDDAINAFARPNWERKQAEKEAAGKGAAEPYKPHRPASYLRKTFTAAKGEARLYITAKGLYAVWLNGVRVGDMVLAPGSFTGNKHLAAQTYDVTQYLRDGENELLVALGDGWHRSTGGVDGDRDLFGDTLGVLFQLEVDGQAVCASDGTMQATQCGPIRQNDMQQGEVYDARFEGHLTGWHGVRTYRDDLPILGMNTVPILEHEAFPGKLLQTPNGETVLDFGQNIAGYVEMALTARAGQKVKLTCGEALDENGNFTFRKFRKPVSCTNPVDHADGRQFLHRIIPAVSGRQIDMRRTAAAMLEGQDRLIGIYFATPRFFLVPYGRKRNAYMNDIVERSAAIDYLRYMMPDPAFVLRRRDRQYGQLPVKGFGQPRKVISRSCSARTAQDDRLAGLCRQTARHIGRRTLIDRRIDLEIGILLYRSDERYVRSARRCYDFTDVISFQQSDHDLRIAFGGVILFHDICLTIIEKRINYRLISFRMSSNKLRGIYLAARYAKRNFTDGISRSGVRSPVILSQRASAVQTICANRGFRTKRSRQNRNPSAGFVKPAVSQNRSICVLSNLRSYHLSYRT